MSRRVVRAGEAPAGRRRSGLARRRRDRGAAAVEAALVFPILLLLIFGIIDFGRMLNAQMNATEAAQQGARIASFGERPDTRIREIAGTEARIAAEVCALSATGSTDADVTVTYPFEFVTPVGAFVSLLGGGGLGGTVELTGHGVMPCS
ncbi:TadE/TadG family type IV pilus assembly protein [Asanoa sp. WMMD1127]|uniref:TadE/TadG family type IV pilus assembly protein n=1 Tax=Asanoa sp. WMMD1127 TaxID=3016107 RepID=UPI002417C06F|nr:TadE/TadG family type IV pilus assembly protein [Asanoa sp. WMMD1127]MDG4823922.1 TadE/TadG family type IV pilus assembly protein [Asanoa sp. WMMD1127]